MISEGFVPFTRKYRGLLKCVHLFLSLAHSETSCFRIKIFIQYKTCCVGEKKYFYWKSSSAPAAAPNTVIESPKAFGISNIGAKSTFLPIYILLQQRRRESPLHSGNLTNIWVNAHVTATQQKRAAQVCYFSPTQHNSWLIK